MHSLWLVLSCLGPAWGAALFNQLGQDDFLENTLSPVGSAKGESTKEDWMEVSQTTGKVIRVNAGQRVELECEVLGKPPPTSAQWFKGSAPITESVEEESNYISGVGLGKLISRYVIECAQPSDRGVYTCRAAAPGQTRVSSPSALVVQGGARCPERKAVDRTPRIVTWSPLVLENMNNDVILPCRARGASVFWLDEAKRPLGGHPDSRIKVSESGALVIRRLRWQDMGGYTCVAENDFGRDTRLTFLYPMLNDV